MKVETAVDLITQAVASFRGTLDDHKKIQEALEVIRKASGVDKADKKEQK